MNNGNEFENIFPSIDELYNHYSVIHEIKMLQMKIDNRINDFQYIVRTKLIKGIDYKKIENILNSERKMENISALDILCKYYKLDKNEKSEILTVITKT